MDTMTDTMQTVTVSADTFRDLLTGTALFMDTSKDAMPRLSCIYLSITGGEIKAHATDRYRLITGTMKGEGELGDIAIRSNDVKSILADLKTLPKGKFMRHEITLSRAGDILTVTIGSSSRTVYLAGETFPPYEHLFSNTRLSVEKITFNPNFMAILAKVPTDSKTGQLTVEFNGDVKPIQFTIPHDSVKWRGLIMPMRIKE